MAKSFVVDFHGYLDHFQRKGCLVTLKCPLTYESITVDYRAVK
jgi:hypothetical protein